MAAAHGRRSRHGQERRFRRLQRARSHGQQDVLRATQVWYW